MSDINLNKKNLKTLKGQNIPEVIDGFFWCNNNYLTNLEFGPVKVGTSFNCDNNKLTSLEFGPKEVGYHYYCSSNQLTSLEFCATKIDKSLYAGSNLITNLKDIHKQFKNGYINGTLNIEQNPLKSHLLGVILIPKLKNIYIDNNDVRKIIKNHFETKDVLECQEELIQNGLKEFAQL